MGHTMIPVSAKTRPFAMRLVAAASGILALAASAGAGAASAAEPLVMVGTDWPGLKGSHLMANPVVDEAGFKGMTFMNRRFGLQEIASKGGAVLWEVQTVIGAKKVFKLRQGWPKNPKSKAENPEIDADHDRLSPSGGFVTLSYLEQGGVFSDEYRHLTLELKCEAGHCKLYLPDGSAVDRLFAFKADNDRGIREIRPVTRGHYANLTGAVVPGGAPMVTERTDKGPIGTGELSGAEPSEAAASNAAK